ncbi:MAG TPA: amidohydrolase [Bryobacteraceae bacterium]|nr:amidohydrolase [Bryobacteraceae bacterium]HOQ46528.1 amidohydrolase [Bryobacteraceae bacterium]HPU73319.1 amidohydrolase [Bryobacteraceae bacterium]
MKTSLVILAFSAVLPALAQRPDLEKLKSEVVAEVEARRALTQQIVDSLFSFAELGFQEFETSAYLTAILEKEGFKVERGVAGMPTAFVASWGSGKPVIGFMADIDGLPATSQKPGIPWHEPLIEGGPGHGEGHNSGPALNITAAIAVKQVMQRHRLPGTIRVYPGVAEELLASRTYMVMAGLFRDVDAMLSCHVASEFSTSYGPRGSGLVSTQFTFEGRSAHSAGSPWSGRSALDAVELMNAGWNFRREHLRPEQRSHYVIVDGGDQPNVVPPTATVWYFFRELDYDRIRELHEIGRRIAAGAAMMTDTTVKERVLAATWPGHFNKPMAEALHANIKRVGMPAWSPEDVKLAIAAQKELGVTADGLSTTIRELATPSAVPAPGGSDDIAEVSWNVPTVVLRYPANIPRMIGHHWSSAIAMATPIAHKGTTAGAKAQAMTAIDLLVDPQLLEAARQYFAEQTKTTKWKSLIPEGTQPPIHLNREKMERFRAQLRPLRYNPAKYKTYLEQLGVAYPTTR